MEDLDPGFGTEGERVGTAKEEEREEAKGAGEKGKGVWGGGGERKGGRKKKKEKGGEGSLQLPCSHANQSPIKMGFLSVPKGTIQTGSLSLISRTRTLKPG